MGIWIVDADSLVYKIGYMADKNPYPSRVYKMFLNAAIKRNREIAKATMVVQEEHWWLTANNKSNYRFAVDPSYKANRAKNRKPSMYDNLRAMLMDECMASIAEGDEADDRVSIEAWTYYEKKKMFLLSSADKDCRIPPGCHHEMGEGPVYEVHMPGVLNVYRKSSRMVWGNGIKWFYFQLLVGDTADHIPGLDISPFDAYMKLKDAVEEKEMCNIVAMEYQRQKVPYERMVKNGQLLWLKTKEDEPLWMPPIML